MIRRSSALHREARARAAELGQKSGLPEEVVQQVLAGVNEPGRFADLVAGYHRHHPGPAPGTARDACRSRSGCAACWCTCSGRSACSMPRRTSSPRCRRSWASASARCSCASSSRPIRRELGEDDERADLEELREKLDALELPADARKEVDREFGRLDRIGRESMESQVIRTYLETRRRAAVEHPHRGAPRPRRGREDPR